MVNLLLIKEMRKVLFTIRWHSKYMSVLWGTGGALKGKKRLKTISTHKTPINLKLCFYCCILFVCFVINCLNATENPCVAGSIPAQTTTFPFHITFQQIYFIIQITAIKVNYRIIYPYFSELRLIAIFQNQLF